MRLFRPWLLIADDDPSFRETLQIVLEGEGYGTVIASSGEEVVSIATQHEVHILLLDFHMPRLTGLEAFRIVRKIRGPLPCILMSAALDPPTLEEARREAIFEVLKKPFSTKQLASVVREALVRSYDWPSGEE